jgi:hypothetical protein
MIATIMHGYQDRLRSYELIAEESEFGLVLDLT